MCHMDYGDFVIDSGTKAYVDELDRLQIRSIRCIEDQFDPDKPKDLDTPYNKYKLEPLNTRRKRNLVKLMYSESKNPVNIDMYRPHMVLRSHLSIIILDCICIYCLHLHYKCIIDNVESLISL